MIVVGLWLGFERTRFGAQIRAAVDNRRMAESLGINIDRLFTITFAFGSGMAALGGGLGAEFLGLDPQYALKYLVFFLIVVAVGGLGRVTGVFYASILIGVLDFVLKKYLPQGGTLFIYALTILLLLWRPQGLFGEADMSAPPPADRASGGARARPAATGCAGGSRCRGCWRSRSTSPFPRHLGFGTELLITILFALSLDLALGYAGIVTLGHAAFFGAGAYTVGMLAHHGIWNEPITSLIARGGGGGADRPRLRPGAAAHHRADAADADALHHGAAGGGGQPRPRLDRRLRRPDRASPIPPLFGLFEFNPLYPEDAVSLRPRACCSSASCSCARWSIRRSARA